MPTHVYIYIYIYIYIYVCIYRPATPPFCCPTQLRDRKIHFPVCMHVCMCLCMYYVYVYIYIYKYTHTHTHMCRHTRIHTHTDTDTDTHTQTHGKIVFLHANDTTCVLTFARLELLFNHTYIHTYIYRHHTTSDSHLITTCTQSDLRLDVGKFTHTYIHIHATHHERHSSNHDMYTT
jgi:hypothetical protein